MPLFTSRPNYSNNTNTENPKTQGQGMKVEKSVPVPDRRRGWTKYPFHSMEIGDSVYIRDKPKGAIKRAMCAAYGHHTSKGLRFRSIRDDDGKGVRIWRIDPSFDENAVKVERSDPPPPLRLGRKPKVVIDHLAVGDSAFLGNEPRGTMSSVCMSCYAAAKRKGWKIKARSIDGGVRIWRVE